MPHVVTDNSTPGPRIRYGLAEAAKNKMRAFPARRFIGLIDEQSKFCLLTVSEVQVERASSTAFPLEDAIYYLDAIVAVLLVR